MKKINFKQPKYIFPLVILLPILFLGWEITSIAAPTKANVGVVTDSLNTSLPDPNNEGLDDKYEAMDKRSVDPDDNYTAMNKLGQDEEQKDKAGGVYSDDEMSDIDKQNASKTQHEKDMEELQRNLAEARKHVNGYGNGTRTGSRYRMNDRQREIQEYTNDLDFIQRRTKSPVSKRKNNSNEYDVQNTKIERKNKDTQVVSKIKSKNSESFNTVEKNKQADDELIKAMIDQTVKAKDGSRLRLKLLDDVCINQVKISKGTYLYANVTGFAAQRVMANITSILYGSRFIRVNLAIYDNDGMEGFYVPQSAFREMLRDAGSQAMQQNLNFNTESGTSISAEAVALQTLQNVYQSATQAVSANMRKNKAKIKYNTIVYLINTNNNQ